MGERHIARAKAIEIAKDVERVLDRVAAFDADHDRCLPVLFRLADPRTVAAERQLIWIARRFGLDQIDGAIREFRGTAARVIRRDVRGEERRRDPALPQRPEVHLRLGVVLIEMDVVAQHAIRRVAVSIDDDRPPVNVIR